MQEKECPNVARRKKEFEEIYETQKSLGINISGDWKDYVNQNSPLQRSCDQCDVCESPVVIAGKAKLGHVCKKLGQLKSVAKRRLNPQTLKERVERLGCKIIDGLQNYENKNSLIKVIHIDSGIELTRPADHFREKGRVGLLKGFFNNKKVGETITVAVSHFLLNCQVPQKEVSEVSPEFLRAVSKNRKSPMRLDAYYLNIMGVNIAIEHQGNYHSDPTDPHYLKKSRTFQEVVDRDNLVRAECKKNKVVLVEIDDIVLHSKDIVDAGMRVYNALCEKVPQLSSLPGIDERLTQLKNSDFIINLCINSGLSLKAERRLDAQLKAEGLPIQMLASDPVSGFIDLRCNDPRHPPHTWKAHYNNLIGSEKTGRVGTRCRKCADLLRGENTRLSHAEVVECGLLYGARALFREGDYKNNSQYLPWECVKDSHSFNETLGHIQEERGCPECRKLAINKARREKEYEAILALVTTRGDTLLSTCDEYQKQTSKMDLRCTREGGCKEEFKQTASKIKVGQLHGCDKWQRSGKKRRARES